MPRNTLNSMSKHNFFFLLKTLTYFESSTIFSTLQQFFIPFHCKRFRRICNRRVNSTKNSYFQLRGGIFLRKNARNHTANGVNDGDYYTSFNTARHAASEDSHRSSPRGCGGLNMLRQIHYYVMEFMLGSVATLPVCVLYKLVSS